MLKFTYLVKTTFIMLHAMSFLNRDLARIGVPLNISIKNNKQSQLPDIRFAVLYFHTAPLLFVEVIYWVFFMPLSDRTVRRDKKAGGETGATTQSKDGHGGDLITLLLGNANMGCVACSLIHRAPLSLLCREYNAMNVMQSIAAVIISSYN